jgi:hypothetical protein
MNTTLAGLRAVTTPSLTEIYQTTDYGGGQWYYDSTDTTSVDNIGTIVVSTNGKRFKRIFDDQLSVTWFGAKGDGSDETIIIEKAIENSVGHELIFPKGILWQEHQFINKQ